MWHAGKTNNDTSGGCASGSSIGTPLQNTGSSSAPHFVGKMAYRMGCSRDLDPYRNPNPKP